MNAQTVRKPLHKSRLTPPRASTLEIHWKTYLRLNKMWIEMGFHCVFSLVFWEFHKWQSCEVRFVKFYWRCVTTKKGCFGPNWCWHWGPSRWMEGASGSPGGLGVTTTTTTTTSNCRPIQWPDQRTPHFCNSKKYQQDVTRWPRVDQYHCHNCRPVQHTYALHNPPISNINTKSILISINH